MITALIFALLLLVLLVIVRETRQVQSRLKTRIKADKSKNESVQTPAWAILIFGLLFGLAGVWMYFSPPSQAVGGSKGSGFLFLVASLISKDYGAAVVFISLGIICLIAFLKFRKKSEAE